MKTRPVMSRSGPLARRSPLDLAGGRGYRAVVVTEDLDAVGLLCPLPVLKARKRLAGLPSGARLRLRADDPAAVVDVPHYCHESGNELLSVEEDGTARIFTIRKS